MGSGAIVALVPLFAAGFLFNLVYYRTRFDMAAADGQRLFFMCAVAGLIIGLIVFPVFDRFPAWMHRLFNRYPLPYTGPLALALLIAPIFGGVCNLIERCRKAFIDGAQGISTWQWLSAELTERRGDCLQQLLIGAHKTKCARACDPVFPQSILWAGFASAADSKEAR